MSDEVFEGGVNDNSPGFQYNLVGYLSPQTVANSQAYTTPVNVRSYRKIKAILFLGNMANETVDFKCYKCDADGSNATQIKAATQRAASATANDNKQIIMYLDATEVSGKNFVKFGVVTGGATGGPACLAVLGEARGQEKAAGAVLQVKS